MDRIDKPIKNVFCLKSSPLLCLLKKMFSGSPVMDCPWPLKVWKDILLPFWLCSLWIRDGFRQPSIFQSFLSYCGSRLRVWGSVLQPACTVHAYLSLPPAVCLMVWLVIPLHRWRKDFWKTLSLCGSGIHKCALFFYFSVEARISLQHLLEVENREIIICFCVNPLPFGIQVFVCCIF